jgi:hypothetical protein
LSSNAGTENEQKGDGMDKPMMQSMDQDAEMDMHEMMNNPEMRARMQKHVELMQAMLNSDAEDPEKMHEMMSDPEMKSMMQMHMKCAQMMHGEMAEENSETEEMDHDHHGGSH